MGFLRVSDLGGGKAAASPARIPRRLAGEGAARSRCRPSFLPSGMRPACPLRWMETMAFFPEEGGFPAPSNESGQGCALARFWAELSLTPTE